MEKIINDFMVTLDCVIPEEYLGVIKQKLSAFLKDYEITEKKRELIPRLDDIDKDLRTYLVALKIEGKSIKTLKCYNYSLSRLMNFYNKPLRDLTTGELQYYLYQIEQLTEMSARSLNNQRVIISAFYSWMVNNDYLAKNPSASIKPIKYEKHTRHYLSGIQMESLRGACTSMRDKAMVEFLYATGCRVEELVNVKITDVNYETKEVILFGKGKKQRVSYLNARAAVALQNYLDARAGQSELLFCKEKSPHDGLSTRTVEQIFKKIGEKAGVYVTPHLIRHTTATDAIDRGMPIEQVQKLLGHESISTTLIYAEVKQENVKNGHQKYIV